MRARSRAARSDATAGEDMHAELRGRQGHGPVLDRAWFQHVGIWASQVTHHPGR
jgi:hypothetical protein